MAFVSQIVGRGKGRRKLSKILAIWKTAEGRTGGRVASDTGLRGRLVDLQIDEETRKVRIGESESGIRVNQKNGAFSCYIRVFEIVGKQKISLEDGGDGWWYGRYAETDNQEE